MSKSLLLLIRRKFCLHKILFIALPVALPLSTQAQEEKTGALVEEEVVVVGTQIKGAAVSDALAISVLDAQEIASLGINSGEELLALIPENGQNFFNDGENFSGGVNAARGDVGAFNLRSLGTGNTLVLLNGRRLVNAASYQTEEIGGSFVPVNTVNSNTILVAGLARFEVLRDGASAIYGADAVAGVVNNVMRTDYEGFGINLKWSEFESIPRDDQSITVEWGRNFNGGRTNVTSFVNYYQRDKVRASDDPRWANSDFMERVPEDSPWFEDTAFRNDSINSIYGQYDLIESAGDAGLTDVITDSAGEFETYPAGSEFCQYGIGYGTCGAIDGQGTYRFNSNAYRDLASELNRFNMFTSITHEFTGGIESFTELSWYESETSQRNDPETSLSSSKLRVGAENYWNPLGPCDSPNRLPDSVIGTDVPCEGLALEIDNYRFVDSPLVTDNDGTTWRVLQGFRGDIGQWSWESAVSWSKAEQDDVTPGRISNTLLQEALLDPTSAAYNPFSGGVDSNIERALVTLTRHNETELKTFDIKFSNADVFALPAGSVAFVTGLELRQESFIDDRDDRLDGTIQFTDWDGDTYPFVADVIGSSPTPDSEGKRDVTSLFAEFQIPVLPSLNVQAAMRYEHFSDTDEATVGKLAFGWQPIDQFMLRGSWSEAFRVPNLVTVNEEIVARANTRTDWACVYAAEYGGDPDQDELDCDYSVQRIAQGSDQLAPEESVNTSLGIVLNPVPNLTLTLDYWSIEKENTIGLVGEENQTLLDLIGRLEAGTANCASFSGNPTIDRAAPDTDEAAYYLAAGICPAGTINFIDDRYANLDTRTVKGHDLGVYYDVDSRIGHFNFSYNAAYLDKFEQKAGGEVATLVEAQESGMLPANFPVTGFADLIGMDGNQKKRESIMLSWDLNNFGAAISGYRIGSFYQSALTLEDGTRYVLPSMTTYDAVFNYRFDLAGLENRLRLGVKNFTDERAPLADRYFGFLTDAHNDYGRYYYVSLKVNL